MFLAARLEKVCASMAFRKRWPGNRFSPKSIRQHDFELHLTCVRANHKRSGTVSFWLRRPRWRCLKRKHRHKHLIPTVMHGGGGLMIVACFAWDLENLQSLSQTWAQYFIPGYSLVKCEDNLSASLHWDKIGPCDRAMIPSATAASQSDLMTKSESRTSPQCDVGLRH